MLKPTALDGITACWWLGHELFFCKKIVCHVRLRRYHSGISKDWGDTKITRRHILFNKVISWRWALVWPSNPRFIPKFSVVVVKWAKLGTLSWKGYQFWGFKYGYEQQPWMPRRGQDSYPKLRLEFPQDHQFKWEIVWSPVFFLLNVWFHPDFSFRP